MLGGHEVSARVRDDAEHVVHVGEAIVALEDLAEERLGFVVLAFVVMLAAEEQYLLDALVHVRWRNVNNASVLVARFFVCSSRGERDEPRLFRRRVGASAIACVAGPFAVVAQRHAPKGKVLTPVVHTTSGAVAIASSAEPAPALLEEHVPIAHTFRVKDLATDSRFTIVSGTVGKHGFLGALAASGLSTKESIACSSDFPA